MHFQQQIVRTSRIEKTSRLLQMEGIFDLEPAETETLAWDVDVSLPDQWQIGAIVGPSGTGKTTVARELAAAMGTQLIEWRDPDGNLREAFAWPREKSIIDAFPGKVSECTGLLSNVGFSSPPAWRRPYHVLSNGQQFRANLARAIAEAAGKPVLFDEFASLVHDQVAKVASAAAAKAIRRTGGKLVAVSWREDIVDFLEPDWVIYMHPDQRVEFRENVGPDGSRGSLWRRPAINLKIIRTDRTAWSRFAEHHYLSGDLHKSAHCFVGLAEGVPAAFTAVIFFPHPSRPGWREHRTVCLPDFQGIGIGNAMSEAIAAIYSATGKPYRSTTSHPSMIRHRMNSAKWKTLRGVGCAGVHNAGSTGMRGTGSSLRLTAGFEYVGPADVESAKRFSILPARPT